MSISPETLAKARRHLVRRDPVFKRLCAAVGQCTLTPEPDGFAILARAIVSQMISTKAAVAISGRLCAALPDGKLTPAGVLAAGRAIEGVGLSGAKVRSLRDLAERAAGGVLPL